MEAAAQAEIPVLKSRLGILDTIVTLAPLLGLLGAVVGMIGSFDVMSEAGLGQPHAVTGGVAEALIATATGLLIAILTLIAYNFFHGSGRTGDGSNGTLQLIAGAAAAGTCGETLMRIQRRSSKKARVEILPMIDTIFFSWSFFMISTLSMSQFKGVPVNLPEAGIRPTSPSRKRRGIDHQRSADFSRQTGGR